MKKMNVLAVTVALGIMAGALWADEAMDPNMSMSKSMSASEHKKHKHTKKATTSQATTAEGTVPAAPGTKKAPNQPESGASQDASSMGNMDMKK